MKFYAVCNVNGPISVELDGDTVDEALASFAGLDGREAIDNARTDIEDEIGIDGSDLSESEMDDRLDNEGAYPIRSLQPIANAHAGTTAHIADGWYLWAVLEESDIETLRYAADDAHDRGMLEACENALINWDARRTCIEAVLNF